MKKSFGIILLGTFLVLSACGDTTNTATTLEGPVKDATAAEQAASVVETPAEEAPAEKDLTVDAVIEKFKAADLEAEKPTDMGPKDVGAAPTRFIEGKRILVPSLGDDAGGRVFLFENQEDLGRVRKLQERPKIC